MVNNKVIFSCGKDTNKAVSAREKPLFLSMNNQHALLIKNFGVFWENRYFCRKL